MGHKHSEAKTAAVNWLTYTFLETVEHFSNQNGFQVEPFFKEGEKNPLII